jgi:ketosteroid isomerase-like protein
MLTNGYMSRLIMTSENSKATNEAQIRALIDDRAKAVRAKDVNGAISSIAPDILSFDVVNPLQHVGSDASRKRAEEWFSSFQGPIGYEIRDLSITAGETLGFSHGLSAVSATRPDGGQLDMWWRTTVCFRKIEGKWMITHEHNSVPFDVESGKASLDLKP